MRRLILKRFVTLLTGLLITGLAGLGGMALVAAVAEFEPPAVESLTVTPASGAYAQPVTYSVLVWNIGYAGLDAQTDFFMDKGRMSRGRSARAVYASLAAITHLLAQTQTDFVALQEVDKRAERSYLYDEVGMMQSALSGRASSFVRNFDSLWIPVPWTHPIGSVVSGLQTLSRWTPSSVTAVALYSQFPIPDRWFTLKRRVMVSRFFLGEHKLALLNLHLSAFDKGGLIRREQLRETGRLMASLYADGFEVIAAGDWNHQLPGVALPPCREDQDGRAWLQALPEDFTPSGWRWAAVSEPTVRTLGAPLGETTCYATIDGALLSPGLLLKQIRLAGQAAGRAAFRYADHSPVLLQFSFATETARVAE